MKLKYSLILSTLVLAVFTACEKRIDLDLDEAQQMYVVEAVVHDSLGDNYVILSKTKPFNDNTSGNLMLSGANVKITDNQNNTYYLYETSAGYYTDSTLQGISNRDYYLTVTVEGRTFTAKSHLFPRVEIDSLSREKTEELFWEDPNIPEYQINCHFTEPQGLGDFYRMKAYVFGEQEDGFITMTDDYFDGLSTYLPLFELSFYEGDSVTVQFLKIDENNYRYFNALYYSQGGFVPGNPETNIVGDNVVGYFGAYAKSEESIIVIPE